MNLTLEEKAKLNELSKAPSFSPEKGEPLFSGIPLLDDFLMRRGGMRIGQVIEWGCPPGRLGRILVSRFLKSRKEAMIWIYPEGKLKPFPPAWINLGLDDLFFIGSNDPIKELRPLFLEATFKVVILDGTKNYSRAEWNFLRSRARENKQLFFVLRPFFLRSGQGNPMASLRLNAWLDIKKSQYCLRMVKGGDKIFAFDPLLLRS